jgi:hypothetical protein
MKNTLITAIVAATLSFSVNAKPSKGGSIEATFDRVVPAVCYVTQSNKVEGKLTFSGENSQPEKIEVFSNTGKIELKYKKFKSTGDKALKPSCIDFSVNDTVITLGDEIEVNQGNIELSMSTDKPASNFEAGVNLSATVTLLIECEDHLSDSDDDNDDD